MRNQRPELSNVVLDSLTESIALLDASGVIVGVNEAWRRFAQGNRGECTTHYIGQNYLDACERAYRAGGDELAGLMYDGLRKVLNHQLPGFSLEYPCHSPTAPRWFVAHITPCDESERACCVVAHEDITARKLAELAVEQAERGLRMILEALPVGVWLADPSGKILQGNAAGRRLWGVDVAATSIDPLQPRGHRLSDGTTFTQLEWAAAHTLRSGEPVSEEALRIICSDGEQKTLLHSTVPLRDATGTLSGAVIIDQDISARHAAEEGLRQAKLAVDKANRELEQSLVRESLAARSDELTGVANRRHFFATAMQIFEAARRYRQPLAVVMLDFDHFKRINDRYGHQAGDMTLRHLTGVVQSHLRAADLLARYGGEEFILLLPETDARGAQELANRIRLSIRESPLRRESDLISVTISAGIAEIQGESDTLDLLIDRADQALYAAKRAGRNRCLIHCQPGLAASA